MGLMKCEVLVAGAIVAAGVAAGCASSGAGRAFDQGDYATSADLADQAVRANPADNDMLALRQRARDRFADQALDRIHTFRAGAHHEAELAEWERMLKQLDGWGGPDALSPDRRAALAAESTGPGLSGAVGAIVGADLAQGRPLAAEGKLAKFHPLLARPELARARAEVEARMASEGRATCERLRATVSPESPYWGLVAARYCGHFGVAVPATPAPPTQPPFDVTGTIKGMTAAQTATLRARVVEWVHASLWNDPLAGAAPRGTIGGAVESSFHRATVTLHAPYEDTIRTSMVGSVRNQMVFASGATKVQREYAYEAEELRGHYGMNVSIEIDFPAQPPVSLRLKRVQDVKGYEHDVTFEPAAISPRRDHVDSQDEWVDSQLDGFTTRVTWALNRKFLKTFCARARYTPEEAARCLFAGQKPPAVMAVVTEALGDSAESALEILRPPPPEPPAPKSVAVKTSLQGQDGQRGQSGAADDEDPIVQ
jgi:hypothetical protein